MLYQVTEAYASETTRSRAHVRFRDHDDAGNPHVLVIFADTARLDFFLMSTGCILGEFKQGRFLPLPDDLSEVEMAQRLKAAFEYLQANKNQLINLWSAVKKYEDEVNELVKKHL